MRFLHRAFRFCLGVAVLSPAESHPLKCTHTRKLASFAIYLAVCLPSHLLGQYVYVPLSNSIGAYVVNPNTGGLTLVQGSPFPTGQFPRAITVDPTSRFFYVAAFNDNTVPGYDIQSATGALTSIPGSPFKPQMGPASVAVTPDGRFAYVTNFLSASVSGFAIDHVTGALKPISGSPFSANFSTGAEPFSAVIDPTGRFLYVSIIPCCTSTLPAGILAYVINPATGALTVIGTFDAGTCCFSTLVVHPSGKYLYGAPQAQNIFGYVINQQTGDLTPVPGSPFFSSIFPVILALDPGGKFLYGGSDSSGGIDAFAISAATGTLVPVAGAPFDVFNVAAFGVGVDPTGRFLYVANFVNNSTAILQAYSIDQLTGAPTLLSGINLPGTPVTAPLAIAATTAFSLAVTPNTGSGASQTFAFQYSDSKGFGSLTIVYAGFGPGAYVDVHSCRTEYYRAQNKLFLKNDAGTEWLGPVTLGLSGTVSNSQCTVDAGASSVSGSGDVLTLNLTLSFQPTFAGTQGIFMYAIDTSGVKTPGRQKVGTWNVP